MSNARAAKLGSRYLPINAKAASRVAAMPETMCQLAAVSGSNFAEVGFALGEPESDGGARTLGQKWDQAQAALDLEKTWSKREILEELLGHIGEEVIILPPFRCDYGYLLSIGKRSFINYNAIILDSVPVTIGERTWIGPGLQLYTACHPLDAATRTAPRPLESAAPIAIGDDVWLGGGVIILPGVTIGAETVIGAGSVVTHDIPPRVVAVGNPCRVIRQL